MANTVNRNTGVSNVSTQQTQAPAGRQPQVIPAEVKAVEKFETHSVVKGDTLWALWKSKAQSLSWEEFQSLNSHIADKNKIWPGDEVVVVKGWQSGRTNGGRPVQGTGGVERTEGTGQGATEVAGATKPPDVKPEDLLKDYQGKAAQAVNGFLVQAGRIAKANATPEQKAAALEDLKKQLGVFNNELQEAAKELGPLGAELLKTVPTAAKLQEQVEAVASGKVEAPPDAAATPEAIANTIAKGYAGAYEKLQAAAAAIAKMPAEKRPEAMKQLMAMAVDLDKNLQEGAAKTLGELAPKFLEKMPTLKEIQEELTAIATGKQQVATPEATGGTGKPPVGGGTGKPPVAGSTTAPVAGTQLTEEQMEARYQQLGAGLAAQVKEFQQSAENLRYLDPERHAEEFPKLVARFEKVWKQLDADCAKAFGENAAKAAAALRQEAGLASPEAFVKELRKKSEPAKNFLQRWGRALVEGTNANSEQLAKEQDEVGAKYDSGISRQVMGTLAALGGGFGKLVNGMVGLAGHVMNGAGAVVDRPGIIVDIGKRIANIDADDVKKGFTVAGQVVTGLGTMAVENYKKRGLASVVTETALNLAPQKIIGGLSSGVARVGNFRRAVDLQAASTAVAEGVTLAESGRMITSGSLASLQSPGGRAFGAMAGQLAGHADDVAPVINYNPGRFGRTMDRLADLAQRPVNIPIPSILRGAQATAAAGAVSQGSSQLLGTTTRVEEFVKNPPKSLKKFIDPTTGSLRPPANPEELKEMLALARRSPARLSQSPAGPARAEDLERSIKQLEQVATRGMQGDPNWMQRPVSVTRAIQAEFPNISASEMLAAERMAAQIAKQQAFVLSPPDSLRKLFDAEGHLRAPTKAGEAREILRAARKAGLDSEVIASMRQGYADALGINKFWL